MFDSLLLKMRGERAEEEFLRHGERIGPYLTCLRGLEFERANRAWYERTTKILSERRAPRAER